jgi:hypothetical protein
MHNFLDSFLSCVLPARRHGQTGSLDAGFNANTSKCPVYAAAMQFNARILSDRFAQRPPANFIHK